MELLSKRAYKKIALCALLVVVAAFFGSYARKVDSDLVTHLLETGREFIYLGLFSMWGVSVYRRVVQKNARRMMVIVSVLVVFWLVIREYKWRFAVNADFGRFLWYLYYLPLLTIPHLSFLISLCLGKDESFRLPRWTYALWGVTATLILLVLTNDLHYGAFFFYGAERSEENYSYGFLFYALAVWGIMLALGSLIVMLTRCRVPKSKKLVWLPMIPFAAAVAYIAVFQLDVPVLRSFIGDLAIVDCLFFVAYFECCIQSGLIQSNTRYYDLFVSAGDLGVQIFDSGYKLAYSSSGAEQIAPETVINSGDRELVLPNGRLLRKMPIRGGWAVWTEDVSELLKVREELKDRQEELAERNALLELEYRREREHRTIEVQNRLYDLMHEKTASQLKKIDELTEKYKSCQDRAEKRNILAHISVLGSYIKRRRDFVLTAEASSVSPEAKLVNAFAESYESLRRLGIKGAFLVRTGKSYVPVSIISEAYDFFEYCVESTLSELGMISVRVCAVRGGVRCAVEMDAVLDESAVKSSFPRVIIEEDEYILPLEGRKDDG